MTNLSALPTALPPGVYRLRSSQSTAAIRRAVEAAGWRYFHLDGQTVHDKASFLAAAAHSLQFPTYVARNWDAFEEAIRDLTWAPAPGYVLLFDNAETLRRGDPSAWQTARSIFTTAVEFWHTTGIPFYILIRLHPTSAPPA